MTVPSIRVDRWLNDPTRRFSSRPVYCNEDLEEGIDAFVTAFLRDRGEIRRSPLRDDDLERMVDSITSEYDSSCDLSFVGDDVEGATRFWFEREPIVMIDRRLSAPNMRQRRRMTIAHELGHVLLHRPLFDRSAIGMMELFPDLDDRAPVYCFRHGIDLGTNWMEWQASYVAGLMLMPSDGVLEKTSAFAEAYNVQVPFPALSDETETLIKLLAEEFEISVEATRVRLLQLHLIEPHASIQKLPL